MTFICSKFRAIILMRKKDSKRYWRRTTKQRGNGRHFAIKSDHRVTRLGKFLRETLQNELPQIRNVIKRKMSILGPRSYLPNICELLQKESEIIHFVPPGITELWQVSRRIYSSYEKWLNLDSWYVRNLNTSGWTSLY